MRNTTLELCESRDRLLPSNPPPGTPRGDTVDYDVVVQSATGTANLPAQPRSKPNEPRSEVGMSLKDIFRRNNTFSRIFENFDLGHPMPSETGRDNSDHIPIMSVDSGTPVAVLVTDPDVPRAPAAPPERPAAEHPGSPQIVDFEEFPRIFENSLKKPLKSTILTIGIYPG